MPYRIDLHDTGPDALDRLVDLGAIDVESTSSGIAALMPDGVAAGNVAAALGVADVRVSPAQGRDDGSVWLLAPKAIRIGDLQIVPASRPSSHAGLRLVDGNAFGTGVHPTTALCLEALNDELAADPPDHLLDVGTGSGILALAALHLGVRSAVAIDIDEDAVRTARDNATLNGLTARFHLVRGGPDVLAGAWPLVLANVLAAPLIDMAPTLVRLVGRRGRLVLGGIRASLASDVEYAYRHLGMRQIRTQSRDGWTTITLQASW